MQYWGWVTSNHAQKLQMQQVLRLLSLFLSLSLILPLVLLHTRMKASAWEVAHRQEPVELYRTLHL